MQLLHEMIDVLLQTFDLFPEQKENSVNYRLCHNMNECQLTYETNGWSYYAQNDQCRSSHQQSVIDRSIDGSSMPSIKSFSHRVHYTVHIYVISPKNGRRRRDNYLLPCCSYRNSRILCDEKQNKTFNDHLVRCKDQPIDIKYSLVSEFF